MNDQPQPEKSQPVEEPARREPVLNLPPVIIFLIGACVLIYFAGEYLLSADAEAALVAYAGFHTETVGAWTVVTLVTYAFLHGSIMHLTVNMIWLSAFGSPLANRMGAARFLAFWAVTAASAVAFYWVLHWSEAFVLIGASGAISGMMGAAARFGFRIQRSRGKAAFAGEPLPILVCLRLRGVVTFLAIWFAINLVTGLISTPGVDQPIAWEAHIGGFLAGFLGIGWFDRRPPEAAPLDNPAEDEPTYVSSAPAHDRMA